MSTRKVGIKARVPATSVKSISSKTSSASQPTVDEVRARTVEPPTQKTVTLKKVATPVVETVPSPVHESEETLDLPETPPVQLSSDPVSNSVSDPVDESADQPDDKKVKRQRSKPRPFLEIQDQLIVNIEAAYKLLQLCQRDIKALRSAHKTELSHSRTRENNARTPTLCLDPVLIAYLRSRLDASDFVVTRKVGDSKVSVDLSGLDKDTPVHRTDVTQLYCAVFAKHNLKDSKDGRNITYQKDSDLVTLLTTGVTNAKLGDDVQAIRDGTYPLNIFNIQKFCSQYFRKIE